jgi:hypothetical protein
LYDWADLPYRALTAPGWQKGLLIRRKIKKPNEFTFYLTLSPTGNTLGRTGAGGRHALDRPELLRDGQRRGRAGSRRAMLISAISKAVDEIRLTTSLGPLPASALHHPLPLI